MGDHMPRPNLPQPERRVALIDCTDGTGHHARYGAEVAKAAIEAGRTPIAVGTPGWCNAMREYAAGIPVDWKFPAGQNYRDRNIEFRKFCQLTLAACRTVNIAEAQFLYIDGFLDALLQTWDGASPRITATLHWYPFISHSGWNLTHAKQWLKGKMTLKWLRQLSGRGARFNVHSTDAAQTMRDAGIHPVCPLVYPHLDQTIVMSEAERRIGRQMLGIQDNITLFLCFGGTRIDKGVDIALQALAKTAPDCHLLIAGAENHFSRADLEDMAKQFGIISRLHLDLRHIPDVDLSRIFSSADVVTLPYRHSFSGQSGPLITAIAIGLPIVASSLRVFEETLSAYHDGTLVPPEDTGALAAAFTAVTARRLQRSSAWQGEHSRPEDDLVRFRNDVRNCNEWPI